jgi:hypothetical protein
LAAADSYSPPVVCSLAPDLGKSDDSIAQGSNRQIDKVPFFLLRGGKKKKKKRKIDRHPFILF